MRDALVLNVQHSSPVAQMMASTSSRLPSVKCTVRPSTRSMPGFANTFLSRISSRMSPEPGLTVGCTCLAHTGAQMHGLVYMAACQALQMCVV